MVDPSGLCESLETESRRALASRPAGTPAGRVARGCSSTEIAGGRVTALSAYASAPGLLGLAVARGRPFVRLVIAHLAWASATWNARVFRCTPEAPNDR